MEVAVLGPVEVHADDGELIGLGGPACRAVMVMLALQPTRVVTVDELVDGLWREALPRDPVAALQVTISRLRTALGPHRSVVERLPGGYRLAVDRSSIDLARAEDALPASRDAMAAGDPETAAVIAGAALESWRGHPLLDFADHAFAADAITRLHLLRLALLEVRNASLIACGRFEGVLADTARFLASDPWQEKLVEQLMIASYETGHHVDALAAYSQLCSALQRDFGVSPSPRIRRLHHEIVEHHPLLGDAAVADAPERDPPSLPRWFQAALDAQHEDDASVRARLLLALGEAQHHAGEPGWDDTLCEAGAAAADAGDIETLARAAVGGAAGWGVQAGRVDQRRLAMVDAALEVPERLSDGMQARLLAARATELSYTATLEERTTVSDESIRLARRSGEPATLLSVLNQRYSNTWSPENLDDRKAHLVEAARLSEAVGHGVASAITHGLLMACAIEAGDAVTASHHLDRFIALGDELDLPMLRWGAVLHSAWMAVLDGDLDRAEALNIEAQVVGGRAHRPEAPVVGAMQLLSIRWAQGRIGEMVESVEAILQWLPHLTGFQAFHALALHGAGEEDRAASALRDASGEGFADLAPNLIYLAALVHWAELAAEIGDVTAAHRLADLLSPVADRFVFTTAAVYGPVAHTLGILAAATGDRDAATRHLRAAHDMATAMPSPFFGARTSLYAARHRIDLRTSGRRRD